MNVGVCIRLEIGKLPLVGVLKHLRAGPNAGAFNLRTTESGKINLMGWLRDTPR